MKWENFRQAVHYLRRVLNIGDRTHVVLSRLPEAIVTALFGSEALRSMLGVHDVTSAYLRDSGADDIEKNPIRSVGQADSLVLGPAAFEQLVQLFVGNVSSSSSSSSLLQLSSSSSSSSSSILVQKEHEVQVRKGLLECCSVIKDTDEVIVTCVRSVIFSGRSARQAIHSDYARLGECFYTVDTPLPHGGIEFKGIMVRVDNIFVIKERAFANVTPGRRAPRKDTQTGCYEYTFKETSYLMSAERIISYAHFGNLAGNRKMLNKYYIPI